jgi:hypothetical protein
MLAALAAIAACTPPAFANGMPMSQMLNASLSLGAGIPRTYDGVPVIVYPVNFSGIATTPVQTSSVSGSGNSTRVSYSTRLVESRVNNTTLLNIAEVNPSTSRLVYVTNIYGFTFQNGLFTTNSPNLRTATLSAAEQLAIIVGGRIFSGNSAFLPEQGKTVNATETGKVQIFVYTDETFAAGVVDYTSRYMGLANYGASGQQPFFTLTMSGSLMGISGVFN